MSKGRLYWSEACWERLKALPSTFGWNKSAIGRLEDGLEVEYNLLISDPNHPEPSEDYKFLGVGEYVCECRQAVNDDPLEKTELMILNSRWIPAEIKQDLNKVARLAMWLRSGDRRK